MSKTCFPFFDFNPRKFKKKRRKSREKAMSEKRNNFQDPKGSNMTFDFTDCTIDKDDSKQVTLEEDDIDAPVVFLCGSCKLPVGDSLSWAGSEEENNQIILKRVSDNVIVGKETHIAGTIKELGCLVVHLTCGGCSSLLGLVYISTPRKLDYIRSLFCLDVAAIESYVLGSSKQQVASLSTKQQPITLEYRQTVEQQLAEIKAVTLSMGQRLLGLEAELQCKSQM
ncbi:protein Mis18-alpha [Esox lucius]|uniref:Protein Mis18-alpha n=1 Tax=Esox lucius TaxID=8010 RepID=A0A3P8ZUE9_ESOLU|nr:protein Mis18-alpha [Esox lucius]